MTHPDVERCNLHRTEFHRSHACPECVAIHMKRQEAVFKQTRYNQVSGDPYEYDAGSLEYREAAFLARHGLGSPLDPEAT